MKFSSLAALEVVQNDDKTISMTVFPFVFFLSFLYIKQENNWLICIKGTPAVE